MMPNQNFRNGLKLALSSDLPGLDAHLMLAPRERMKGLKELLASSDAKSSAVLIVLFPENNQLKVIFILRSIYDGVHSGQISFPGGQRDQTDSNAIETALRETYEEVGLKIEASDVLGKLSNLFIPHSNFIVEPYVAFVENVDMLLPDPDEVQEIYKISLQQLLDESTIQTKEVLSRNNQSIKAPCFYVNDLKIWGATAMILNELLEVIKSNNLSYFLTKKNAQHNDAHSL